MENKVLKIIKISSAFALALLFLTTVLYSYWEYMSSFYYMTFLGNFLTGIFLFIVGILWIFNKNIPQFLILCFTVLMALVFGVTMATQDFYFSDGYLFLHVINPLLMVIFYLLISNQLSVKWYFVFTACAMPLAYMIFAFIFGAHTGDYIYYYLDYKKFGTGNTTLFILGIAVGLVAASIGLYYLNRLIHKRILKNI